MWNRQLRTLIISLLVAFIGTASTTGVVQRAPVAFVGLPDEFEAIADWATDLFDRAGLELPPLRYLYHGDDPTGCSGRGGRHRNINGVSVIDICTSDPSFPAQMTILHETAHAWAERSLTPGRKAAFQELRGWEHWLDYERASWHENGTEQAAEIMVWGLFDRPIRIVQIYDASCDQLGDGYRTLTGNEPLHGYRDLCDGW